VIRVAAIDLGTNATRLLVADVDGERVEDVVRRTRITKLGEGVDARRILLAAPIARVRNVLTEYRREAEELGARRVLAVATSAVRDAENGEAFLGEVEWSYGFTTRLLSGDEEAALTLRGVGPLEPGTVVIDVGGGSTEFVVGADGEVSFFVSVQAGVVRHTERFVAHDPPQTEETQKLAEDVRARFADALPETVREEVAAVIGVAGTATSVAAMDLALERYDPDRVEGFRAPLGTVEELLARLATMTEDERREVAGLHPDRAPTIVAGLVILLEALRALGVDEFEVSEHDILRGAALAAAGRAPGMDWG
jgi:exopolyphosphatase/guanosine-5'-triphosphate,3'-diphosphate pyrophosphatase